MAVSSAGSRGGSTLAILLGARATRATGVRQDLGRRTDAGIGMGIPRARDQGTAIKARPRPRNATEHSDPIRCKATRTARGATTLCNGGRASASCSVAAQGVGSRVTPVGTVPATGAVAGGLDGDAQLAGDAGVFVTTFALKAYYGVFTAVDASSYAKDILAAPVIAVQETLTRGSPSGICAATVAVAVRAITLL